MQRGSVQMKRAYLIYHKDEAEKNKGFIELFRQAGKRKEIDFSYVPVTGYQKISEEKLPELVLNRTRDPEVSRWYEERGIPVHHDSRLVAHANHKYQMIRYFEEKLPETVRQHKWCPATRFIPDASKLCSDEAVEQSLAEGYEVIKSVSGHGGSEVFLLEDRVQWEKVLAGKEVILQEKIECHSRDMRVYVLFGEIYCAMLREGKHDFRSNFSLGGSVRKMGLTDRQRKYIDCFIKCLPGHENGMYSIDFLPTDDGDLLFDEVEEMVGCRMLYQHTEYDIVADYMKKLNL